MHTQKSNKLKNMKHNLAEKGPLYSLDTLECHIDFSEEFITLI